MGQLRTSPLPWSRHEAGEVVGGGRLIRLELRVLGPVPR